MPRHRNFLSTPTCECCAAKFAYDSQRGCCLKCGLPDGADVAAWRKRWQRVERVAERAKVGRTRRRRLAHGRARGGVRPR